MQARILLVRLRPLTPPPRVHHDRNLISSSRTPTTTTPPPATTTRPANASMSDVPLWTRSSVNAAISTHSVLGITWKSSIERFSQEHAMLLPRKQRPSMPVCSSSARGSPPLNPYRLLHSTHCSVGSVRILSPLFALIPCGHRAFLPPSKEIAVSMKQKEVVDWKLREQWYNHYLQNIGEQLTVFLK